MPSITARVALDHALDVYLTHARDLLPVVRVQRAPPSHTSIVHQDRHRTQLCFGAGNLTCCRRYRRRSTTPDAETAATIGHAAPAEPLGAWETQEWGYVLFRNNCAKSHTRIFSARVSPTHRWPNEEKRRNIEVRGRKIDSEPNGTGAVTTPRPQMQEPRDVMATPRGPRSLQWEPLEKDAHRATVRRQKESPGA